MPDNPNMWIGEQKQRLRALDASALDSDGTRRTWNYTEPSKFS